MNTILCITPMSTAWYRLTMAAILTGSLISMGTAVHAAEQPILVAIDDVTVEEPGPGTGTGGTRYAYFTLTLSEESVQDVEIRYETTDDTATAFTDYSAESGTVIFRGPRLDKFGGELPGETMKLIAITIKSDTLNEPSETFFVNLSKPGNLLQPDVAIADGQGVATITPPLPGGGDGSPPCPRDPCPPIDF